MTQALKTRPEPEPEPDIETNTRCAMCGERLIIRHYPGTKAYRATCGSPVACGTGVYETTKEWLVAEFCHPTNTRAFLPRGDV